MKNSIQGIIVFASLLWLGVSALWTGYEIVLIFIEWKFNWWCLVSALISFLAFMSVIIWSIDPVISKSTNQ